MLFAAIVIIVVGIAIAMLLPHPQAHALGALVVVIGLVVLLYALFASSDADVDAVIGLPGLLALRPGRH